MRPGPMRNGRLPRKPRGPAAEGRGAMPTEEPGDAVRRAVPKGRQAQGRGRSSHKVPRQMWPCSRVCVPVPAVRIKAACTAPTLHCGAGGGVGTAYPSAEKQGLTPRGPGSPGFPCCTKREGAIQGRLAAIRPFGCATSPSRKGRRAGKTVSVSGRGGEGLLVPVPTPTGMTLTDSQRSGPTPISSRRPFRGPGQSSQSV